jgi:anti-sigma B factor antagonist
LFATIQNLPMHFTIDKNDKHVVIKLHEEKLNTLIAAELKSELLLLNTQGYSNIILDLSESLYCDSSGLSAILVGNRLCRNSNGAFIVTGLNEMVLKLIQISQLDQVLNILPNVSESVDFVLKNEMEQHLKND